eukprot:912691_1
MCERGLEQKDEQDEIGEAGEDQESDKRIEGSELEDNLSIKSILQNVDVSEFTSLIASCQNGHGTTAQLLLANNADPNEQTPNGGVSALMLAAQENHVDIIQLLLQYQANILLGLPRYNW